MLDSIYKTWRWPRVTGKVEHDPKNPLEYAKIWRIAQQAAPRVATLIGIFIIPVFYVLVHGLQERILSKRPASETQS